MARCDIGHCFRALFQARIPVIIIRRSPLNPFLRMLAAMPINRHDSSVSRPDF